MSRRPHLKGGFYVGDTFIQHEQHIDIEKREVLANFFLTSSQSEPGFLTYRMKDETGVWSDYHLKIYFSSRDNVQGIVWYRYTIVSMTKITRLHDEDPEERGSEDWRMRPYMNRKKRK